MGCAVLDSHPGGGRRCGIDRPGSERMTGAVCRVMEQDCHSMPEIQPSDTQVQQADKATPAGPESTSPVFDTAALDQAIQSSLQTVDQELANLEAALQEDFSSGPNLAEHATTPVGTASATAKAGAPPTQAGASIEHPSQPVTSTSEMSVPPRTDSPPIEPASAEPPPATEVLQEAQPPALEELVIPSKTPKPEEVSDARSADAPARPARLERLRALLTAPLRFLIWTLLVLDWPFSRLSRRVKNVIGWAGIATCAVAVLTWAAGSHLPRWAATVLPPSPPHTAAPSASAAGSDQPAH